MLSGWMCGLYYGFSMRAPGICESYGIVWWMVLANVVTLLLSTILALPLLCIESPPVWGDGRESLLPRRSPIVFNDSQLNWDPDQKYLTASFRNNVMLVPHPAGSGQPTKHLFSSDIFLLFLQAYFCLSPKSCRFCLSAEQLSWAMPKANNSFIPTLFNSIKYSHGCSHISVCLSGNQMTITDSVCREFSRRVTNPCRHTWSQQDHCAQLAL